MRQLDERDAVEANHVGLAVARQLPEAPERAVPGVVADARDVLVALQEGLDQGGAGHVVGEVTGMDLDVRAVGLAQLLGQLVEALAAARHEDQAMAALGQLAREFGADAGGGPGDEDRVVGSG